MLKELKTIHKNPKLVILVILISFFSFIILANIINKIFYYEDFFSGQGKLGEIHEIINTDIKQLSQNAQTIAESPKMIEAIKENDLEKINYILNEEEETQNLSSITVINSTGIALSRKSLPDHIGDYVLKNAHWGNLVSNGKSVNIIEPGSNYSELSIKSVYPIIENDKFIGAILTAKKLDDQYALSIKKVLNNDAEIIFYSKENGIVSSSFELDKKQYTGNETKFFMNQYLNSHSNLNENNNGSKIHLKIDGTNYSIFNIKFNNLGHTSNGLLILSPQEYHQVALLISFIFSVLLAWLLIQYLKNKNSHLWTKGKLNKKNIIFITSIFLLNFILLTFISAKLFKSNYTTLEIPNNLIYNSVLKLSPEHSIIDKNFQHKISIKIEPGGEQINAISAHIKYDPNMLNVLDIVKTNSICRKDLFLEQTIDNEKGEVRIACVLPDFNLLIKEGIIADLVIQAKQSGSFNLEFEENSQVLANDGLGTNVLRASIGGSYQVQDFTNKHTLNTLDPPIVISSTHPNTARWYNKKDIKLSWLNHHQRKYAYLFDKNPYSIPMENNGVEINNVDRIDLSVKDDGIYYFHTQVYNEDFSYPSAHFKLMIDSKPPEFIEKKLSQTEIKTGEVIRISFEAQDHQSGIQSYYIKINNGILLPVVSPIYIPLTEVGMHDIIIRAYDNTDNYTDELLQVKVKSNNLFKNIINIDLIKWFR